MSEFSSLLAACLYWLLTTDSDDCCQLFVKSVCGLMVVECRCVQMFVKDAYTRIKVVWYG